MILIVQEDEDGIFVSNQAVVADWFINMRRDGKIVVSDSYGKNKTEVTSVDAAVTLIGNLKALVV